MSLCSPPIGREYPIEWLRLLTFNPVFSGVLFLVGSFFGVGRAGATEVFEVSALAGGAATASNPVLALVSSKRTKNRKKKNRSAKAKAKSQRRSGSSSQQAWVEGGVRILPVVTYGVVSSVASDVDRSLRTQALGFEGVKLLDDSRLGSAPSCVTTRCLSTFGKEVGAPKVISVVLGSPGGVLTLSARWVDAQAGRELDRATLRFDKAEVDVKSVVNGLLTRFMQPKAYVGQLFLSCAQEGASMYIDDAFVGQTPLEEKGLSLRAGNHILRVAKEGFKDVYRFIDVPFEASRTIEIDLDKNSVQTFLGAPKRPPPSSTFVIRALPQEFDFYVDGLRLERPTDPGPWVHAKVEFGMHILSVHPTSERENIERGLKKRQAQREDEKPDGAQSKPSDAVDTSVLEGDLKMPWMASRRLKVDDTDSIGLRVVRDTDEALYILLDNEVVPSRFTSVRRLRWLGYSGVGLGVGALAGALYFSSQVDDAQTRVDRLSAQTDLSPEQLQSLRAQIDTLNQRGRLHEFLQYSAAAVGVGAVTAGVIWILKSRVNAPPKSARSPFRVEPRLARREIAIQFSTHW